MKATKLPSGWNHKMYYYYIVSVDGIDKEIRSNIDGQRLSYRSIIDHFKSLGASKVWVKYECKSYYKVFC